MSCNRGPAVREPEQGIVVRARLDEVAEFAVRYESVANLVRVQKRVVARRFIVETESAIVVADLHNAAAAVAVVVSWRRQPGRHGQVVAGGGPLRIQGQHVLDIREDQLLVLLFVVQPQHDYILRCRIEITGIEQPQHLFVDMGAVGQNFIKRRPGNQAPLRPRMHIPDRVVVGVEQVVIRVIQPRHAVGFQDEALEEPGDVREVPLGGAHVGHRLHDGILLA